jgi:hypothetical protein
MQAAAPAPAAAAAAGAAEDLFRTFPDQWPDRTHTTAEQRREYETKRAEVFALAQTVAAAKDELAARRRFAAMLAPLSDGDQLLAQAAPSSALHTQLAAVTALGAG